MHTIYLDADACPVKDETYRVARRYGQRVVVVANTPLRVPTERVQVSPTSYRYPECEDAVRVLTE
jgi:uncharacterized protein YaiI (UPF0178 family)